MRLRNSADGYGAVPQVLHWAVVALVGVAWLLGTFDDVFPRGAARAAVLFIHISLGLGVAVFIAMRFAWRIADPPPPPESIAPGGWADRAARFTHWALYALLIAVPAAGIVLQFARGDALPVFGLTEIATPWPRDRAFARTVKEIHEVLANSLAIMAGLHAAAALVHHWILRDRTLLRMLPGAKR